MGSNREKSNIAIAKSKSFTIWTYPISHFKESCDDNDDVLIESTITTKSGNDTSATNEASDNINGAEGSVKKEKNKVKNKKNSIGNKSANDSVIFQVFLYSKLFLPSKLI